MKKRKFLIFLFCLSAMLGLSATVLTSCKTDEDNPPAPEVEYWQVTIDYNDGKTSTTTRDVVKGERLTGVATPTREGYEFTGWTVNGAPWKIDTAITANITIVAQWKEIAPAKEYWTVTIDLNDGTTPKTQQVEKGQKLTGVATPTREGYEFIGWKANDADWTMDTAITASITIVAQWNKIIQNQLESISLSGGKTEFTIGEDFSYEDLIVTAKMSDDTTKEVTDFIVDSSEVDKTKEGTYTITVSYEGKTATYKVTYEVSTIIASIEVSGADDETYEYNKEYVRSSSVKVTAIYTDGHTMDLDSDAEISYSLSSADENGTKICTVKYGDLTTTYAVHIVKFTTPAVEAGKIFMNGTEYATIKEAFDAIPATSTAMYTITLGKGTYNENGLMYKGSATIRISGSTDAKYGSDVIIKGHGSKMPGETGCDSKNRCLISIQGSANIILENLTLESDWYRADHSGDVQAEVLGTDTTGYTAAYNCGFKSHQDTLRTIGKAWFYGCYVEGDVDFIWMEAGGKVALYENCEIVSVWDAAAKTHNTYLTAPKMAETAKLGKGLVIYNSTVKESTEAKAKDQKTYLARTPWSSGCYNQVAYINTTCEDIELSDGPWYKTQIATPFAKTIVGWKMDKATADSIGIQGTKDYILDANTVATEFNGRNAILNRVFDTGKLRYVTDTTMNWEINVLIGAMGWTVTEDTSSDKLDGDTMGASTIYNFKVDGDNGAICDGFTFQDNNGNTHYVSQGGGTITIPVNGKCYVEVYGYYAGVAEIAADTQEGKMIMFFNNATTNSEVENDYIVYDENARSVIITAKSTTYITKIVVTPDSGIEDQKVESLKITGLNPKQIVNVPQTLKAELGPNGVLNPSVLWSSSDEAIATVDQYTGKVTFLAEGKVTITATACDGSGISASVECNPIIPSWTAVEWYTTDTTIATEIGADGIDMFDVNNSANKKLSKSYQFKNLAGKTITSNYGFKLNSAGKLSFATLRYAEVSLIVAPQQNELVNPPLITNADGSKAILLSQYVDENTKLQYFVYALTATGMWNIERLDSTVENNPILYAKVEYTSDEITESVGVTFKGSFYNTSKTGIETIITPGSVIDASNTTTQFYKLNLTNCESNGNAENWLKFNTGAKIEFKVDRATTLLVGYYSKMQTIKLDGVVIEGNKTSIANGGGEIVMYEIPSGGVVTIEATVSDYLGFVGVLFKTLEQKKEDACSNLDKLYPANKYTQNADYETTLEAQKASINAALDEEALAAAIAAAKEALDALEQDPVVEYAETLNYVFVSLSDKPEDGTAVESTDVITFTGCVAHNGQYVALKNDNEVKIRVAAGSTLTVAMPYSSGVTLNGEAYTLEDNKLVYTATENTEVIITGAAGNSYIESIVITKAPTYAETLNYVFVSLSDKPEDGTAVEST
ncbi:MAG: InlB B-repeat-containing protein, partial [Anaeroplasmataceae bacterium]|nr:InlB B-repeat-containing protein [Anaeroplasmataceae bacterium]